ncbi:SDR family NAD(P)-dependent oxidoreductase [Methylotenera sp. 1P/1]|jgi:NAD(P)-dependent dehydrogenase (short-subunit alcohol dehydrogenase family)|uniref:SDR family NAD(P)-dependent oxidoreductase n=1 Tax=Methylotenera sp. 1P/1 TaxID=1131551 RepID=UPI0003792DD4|nr:SDR family oxidoreductase [Methylotenera sp. 1P/1]
MDTKTVVITGASSGIGFALAEAYLKRGYHVVGNGRTQDRLDEAAKKLGSPQNFVGVAGDISKPDTAKELFSQAKARFGKVDILINNAGVFIAKPITAYTDEDVNQLIDTNLKGFFYPSREAAAHMSENKSGHIVNITASVAIQPNINVPASLAILIKGGIDHATKALSLELSPFNIQVNSVAPGIIDTPMHSIENHPFLKALHPSNKMGTTKDIVDAVMYLADAQFTTGIVLPVDGGSSSGKW